jgi:heat shock protein beta
VISNRLVKSPCAIVADAQGYTANVARMMSEACKYDKLAYIESSTGQRSNQGAMHEYAMKAKHLEINPRSPLIHGILLRVNQLPSEEEYRDIEAEEELKEVTSILIDGALVRSGFGVTDSHQYDTYSWLLDNHTDTSNRFFSRVDRVLRRSLGVSETAKTDESVKPAPPVETEAPAEVDESDKPGIILPDHMKDKVRMDSIPTCLLTNYTGQVQIEMEEIDEEVNPVVQHDEL